MIPNLTDEQCAELGENLIELLELKKKAKGQVSTLYGLKNAQGLGSMVALAINRKLEDMKVPDAHG